MGGGGVNWEGGDGEVSIGGSDGRDSVGREEGVSDEEGEGRVRRRGREFKSW